MTELTDKAVKALLEDDGRGYPRLYADPSPCNLLHDTLRALLDARAERDSIGTMYATVAEENKALEAELTQARADTEAAVALVVEEAVKEANDEAEYQASVAKNQDANGMDWRAADWASRKLREVEAAIRALAPPAGVAKLEALRAERDRWKTDAKFWENRENEALKRAEKAEAELAAAQQREAFLVEKVLNREPSLTWIIENTSQVSIRDLALDMLDQQSAALSHNGRKGE